MSDNNTNGLNSTVSDDVHPSTTPVGFIIFYVVTLASLLYGLISWCIMKKFRNYRNYVFLSSILANFLLLSCSFYTNEMNWVYFSILFYFYTVKHYWLLIISHMFYADFVQVFNGHIKKKYLKSGIFSWGVPFIPTIGTLFFGAFLSEIDGKYVRVIMYVFFGSLTLPLIINCVLYVIILCTLCRSFNTSGPTSSKIKSRLSIATLIFILCDVSLLSSYIIMIVMKTPSPGLVVEFLLLFWTTFALEVFLVVGKRNREVWSEYIARHLAKYKDRFMTRRISPEIVITQPPVQDHT